jgi:hypothetical protein
MLFSCVLLVLGVVARIFNFINLIANSINLGILMNASYPKMATGFFMHPNPASHIYTIRLFLSISTTAGIISQNMLENAIAYPKFFIMQFFMLFMGFLYNFSLILGKR